MTEYKTNSDDVVKVGDAFYRLNNYALYKLEYTEDVYQVPVYEYLNHEDTTAEIRRGNSTDEVIPLKQGDIIKGNYGSYVVVANKLIPLTDFKCALRELTSTSRLLTNHKNLKNMLTKLLMILMPLS